MFLRNQVLQAFVISSALALAVSGRPQGCPTGTVEKEKFEAMKEKYKAANKKKKKFQKKFEELKNTI